MSKIQDALKRLQSEDASSRSERRGSDKDTMVLAKISDTGVNRAGIPQEGDGPIIELDHEALRDSGLIAPDYHEQMLADEYRNIKRPLIANAYGKRVTRVDDGNIIAITSALPGEGKTFTAMNLAISIAQEQDYSVLLVDVDVAKPHISEVFGLDSMPGLLDVLEGKENDPERLILRTDMRGLSIFPAGVPRHNATELLSSARMERLVSELATRYPNCLLLLDTPPLLKTSESRAITNLAGQIVLVVKAEETAQGAVEEALRILGDDAAVNLILNQSMSKGSEGHYDYGYGYGYGYSNDKNQNKKMSTKSTGPLKENSDVK